MNGKLKISKNQSDTQQQKMRWVRHGGGSKRSVYARNGTGMAPNNPPASLEGDISMPRIT